MPITVDVAHRPAFGIVTIRDLMWLPGDAEILRIFEPPDSVHHPTGGDHVRRAVMVHIDGPLTAVRDELAKNPHLPELMASPLSTVRAGILVPIGAAQQV